MIRDIFPLIRKRQTSCLSIGLAITSLLAFVSLVSRAGGAGPIVDSGGFESPGYVLGPLQGQKSWVTVGGQAGTATVESSVAFPGTAQAVQVNRGQILTTIGSCTCLAIRRTAT